MVTTLQPADDTTGTPRRCRRSSACRARSRVPVRRCRRRCRWRSPRWILGAAEFARVASRPCRRHRARRRRPGAGCDDRSTHAARGCRWFRWTTAPRGIRWSTSIPSASGYGPAFSASRGRPVGAGRPGQQRGVRSSGDANVGFCGLGRWRRRRIPWAQNPRLLGTAIGCALSSSGGALVRRERDHRHRGDPPGS